MPTKQIFICHSSKDKEFVGKLANNLTDAGINVWYDKWEIKVGDSIIDKINSGILESHYMGVVLSPNSIDSLWVKKEMNAGFIKEISERRVTILPILLKSCIIPPLLSDKRYADFTGDYAKGLSDLLDVFDVSLTTSGRKPVKGHLLVDNTIDNLYRDNFIK